MRFKQIHFEGLGALIDDFEAKINGELVNNFSNLVNRVLSLTFKHFNEIPEVTEINLFNDLNKIYKESIFNKTYRQCS